MIRKNTLRQLALAAATFAAAAFAAPAAEAATWSPFIIRQANTQPATTALYINGAPDGSSVSTQIDEGGEKTGYGTSDYDGLAVTSLQSVSYVRNDAGAPDPYVNIWVTDGTNYAVLAPVANMQSGGGYTSNDVNGLNLQTLGFNIYEYTSPNFNWLIPGSTRQSSGLMHSDGTPVLLSELGSLSIDDPNPGIAQGGTGAPKNGNGFNLIFGDTQGNFVTPMPYSLSNVAVAVPEPTGIALLCLGAGALLLRRRRSA
jgi:hypothetical protein